MKKSLMVVLVALMAASMLIGCAAPAAAEKKVYTKADTNISVKEGEEFTITLDENPTTGYQWSYTVSDDKILTVSKDEYVSDETKKNVEGAGGQRVLTYKANAKGTATIDMVYERSWEKNDDDEKVSFAIEVK